MVVLSDPSAQSPTDIPGHRKRSRWWWSHRGNGPVDLLELQPLQSPRRHHYPSEPTSPRLRTLELILGLEEPIAARKYDFSNGDLAVSPSFLDQYFYPPDLPHSIQIWRWTNICIPVCYLTVGIMQGMVRPLLNVYPLDLGATEAQQTMLASIATLPSALKIVFGFWSDNVPIAGYRRKPYMLFGWVVTSTAMAVLLYSTDLSVPVNLYDRNGTHQRNLPSMEWLMIAFFVTGCGIWLADVMVDSLIAQKVVMEPLHAQGQMQSSCYACRFFGLAVAAPMSTYLYSSGFYGMPGPASIVIIMAVFPVILVVPLWFLLEEERNIRLPSTMDQCREIWKTVCSRAVWQPIGFVYLYNIMQVPNAAWRQYLKSVLHFTSNQLNVLLTASFVLLYLGTVIYKHFFIKTSWRRLYYMGFALNAIASLGQIALIRGYTFGLSPFFFALGDDALVEFIVGMQMLPICIMMVSLCPPNSEGASYAMFTTAWNSAMLLAQAFGSSILLGIWDTSKETMLSGNLDGLFKLSILTTLLQMSPIVFVSWLPHGRTDLVELAGDGDSGSSSTLGGGIFLFVVLSSIVYTVGVTLLNVLAPGWAGES
jgi:MFS family permease